MIKLTKTMKSRLIQGALMCAVATAALGGTAHAATQGTLEAKSTGEVSISVSVQNRTQIAGMTDVSFLTQDPNTAASSAQNVCLWSNTATKGYTITASGSGDGSAFTLASGSDTVPYSVQWSESSDAATGTALTTATASAGLVSTATQQTCATGEASSAGLIVNIGTSDLGSMQAATAYTGTLTLLVTPA